MGNDLAVVDKRDARLAHPAPEFSSEQVRLLAETIAKGCDQNELGFFLNVCKMKRLDPFGGQVHVVKRWDSDLGREKMTIQVGIDGFRVIAARTGEHAGTTEPEYDSEDGQHPNWARVTVYRYGRGDEKIPYTVKARYSEFVVTKKDGNPNRMWATKPYIMLAKCFSPDTQVLTDKGFQRFDSVTGRILQVTEDGLEVTNAVPFVQDYDGPMISSNGDMLNFSVTPNHDMVTTVGKVEAGAMYATLRTRPAWFIPLTIEGDGGKGIPLTDDDIRLAGVVAADGYHNGYRKFHVGVSKPRKIELMRSLSPSVEGVQHSKGAIAVAPARSVRSNFDKALFTFEADRVALLMDEEKQFSDMTLSLNKHQARLLLDTWMFCDGHENKKTGVRRLYASRPTHVGVIEVLAAIAGYSVNVPRPRTSDISDRENFAITVSEPGPAPVVLPTGDQPGLVIEKNDSGKVWCCTVPSGRIIVRRNGFSMVCGNCAEAQALRKAFPDELSGMYSEEEMGQADNDGVTPASVTKPPVTMPRSTDEKKAEPKPQTAKAETVKQNVPAQTQQAAGGKEEISGEIEKVSEGKGKQEGSLWIVVNKKIICIPKEKIDAAMVPGAKVLCVVIPNNGTVETYTATSVEMVVPPAEDGEIIDAEVSDAPADSPLTEEMRGVADDLFGENKPKAQTKLEPPSRETADKPGTAGFKRAQRLHTLITQNSKNTGFTEDHLKRYLAKGQLTHARDLPCPPKGSPEFNAYEYACSMAVGEIDWHTVLED